MPCHLRPTRDLDTKGELAVQGGNKATGLVSISDCALVLLLNNIPLSLLHLLRACPEAAGAAGNLPTQRRHSSTSPSARSQRPISSGGRPESFAHAQFK